MSKIYKPPLLDGESRVVFFDNICHLCIHSVQSILKHNKDQSIQFASIQSELGSSVLSFYGLPTQMYETMLYIEKGQLYTKSTAAIKIAKRLSFPWCLLQAGVVIPRFIRDGVYDLIARNRYKLFGKRDQCYLPDEKTLKRFLDV
jgi:predicted DCC family thiol-disulfide oxidoreductase YuxK